MLGRKARRESQIESREPQAALPNARFDLTSHFRPMTSNLQPDKSTPKRHRPHIGAACDAGRRRKARCNGRQPICFECERRNIGHSCTWDHPRRRALKRTAHDRSLEQVIWMYTLVIIFQSCHLASQTRLPATPCHVDGERYTQAPNYSSSRFCVAIRSSRSVYRKEKAYPASSQRAIGLSLELHQAVETADH